MPARRRLHSNLSRPLEARRPAAALGLVAAAALLLPACGGVEDPFRCDGLPCTPSYSVDSEDLAIRVELNSDGTRVSGEARLDTGNDLDLPVILDDEQLLLRQGGSEIEFRADSDETVHRTRGTLAAAPGERYTLRYERQRRRLEGDVILPPTFAVQAPADASSVDAALPLPVDTDLDGATTMRARADLRCRLDDGRSVGPRGFDLAVGLPQAVAGGTRRVVGLDTALAAFEGSVNASVTDCEIRLGLSVETVGDMPSALDSRSHLIARFVRVLSLRYVAP